MSFLGEKKDKLHVYTWTG